MNHFQDTLLTATAPIIWGSTYWVTSELLPAGYPITVAMLRALPAGILLLLIVRHWPTKTQWQQAAILGALNFTIFWVCLFIAAYRLPGGVAATLGAIQPLIVMVLSYAVLRQSVSLSSILCAIAGIFGVALLVLQSSIHLDSIGIIAALCGALAMALGTILSKKWRGDIPLLTFTSWQLTAGGLLLLPLAWWFEPSLPALNADHVLGLSWLAIAGAAISYSAWFRGVTSLGPVAVSVLMFLSPLSAIFIGWLLLEQRLNLSQIIGCCIIFTSIIFVNLPNFRSSKPASAS